MASLMDPDFWNNAGSSVGRVQNDGSLNYVLLDKSYSMKPLVRDTSKSFTSYVAGSSEAANCKVVVNGNFYDVTLVGKVWAGLGYADDPASTKAEGLAVRNGRALAGDSRPLSFTFGQFTVPRGDAYTWTYAAVPGDPPLLPSTLAAVGGAGPLIVGARMYGERNTYSKAPPGVVEPAIGQPPAPAMDYLIQRSNATFKSANELHPATGKTILAYCYAKRMILVAVQPHGTGPGQTHSHLAFALAQRGFESAVFYDGSDSATLIVEGEVIVRPADRKDDTMDVGIGFFQ